MPREYRLSRTDFERMRGFQRVPGRFFMLSYGTIPQREAPGIAVVVSKKVAPKAPGRNRIKRRARAVLQGIAPGLTKTVVFMAKKGAAEASFADIRADIQDLVARMPTSG